MLDGSMARLMRLLESKDAFLKGDRIELSVAEFEINQRARHNLELIRNNRQASPI